MEHVRQQPDEAAPDGEHGAPRSLEHGSALREDQPTVARGRDEWAGLGLALWNHRFQVVLHTPSG